MNSFAIGGIVFGCTFGGAVLGMLLSAYLRDHHRSSDTKDVIKFSTGVISTMAALVLGLLVGSAKATFDTQREGLAQISASIVYLDRVLSRYGPETGRTRDTLRLYVQEIIERVWPHEPPKESMSKGFDPSAQYDAVFNEIQALTPTNDAQRVLQGEASNLIKDIARTRWSLFAHQGGSIPRPFFVVVILWFTLILFSFGLFARPNTLVVAALLICTFVLSSAIFLITELDQPFHGIIQISSQPLQNALKELDR